MNEKYLEAVKIIKTAILRSQNRAAKYTNTEMLSLYYAIGGYVSGNSREGTWGTGAIDEISARLREELPGLRGFSSGNIKLMRHFFEAWQPYLQTNTEFLLKSKSVATAIDLEQSDDVALAISQKRLPEATDFPMEAFNEISFTHHMEILHKTKELDERLFYIRECALGHWSKTALRTRLKENLYQHKGALTNNFSMAIPDDKQYMKAVSYTHLNNIRRMAIPTVHPSFLIYFHLPLPNAADTAFLLKQPLILLLQHLDSMVEHFIIRRRHSQLTAHADDGASQHLHLRPAACLNVLEGGRLIFCLLYTSRCV